MRATSRTSCISLNISARPRSKDTDRIYAFSDQPWQLYCTVDASYLLHPDSKGHTGYTLGLFREGTFYNRSAKQALVSTSSTHAELRAIYTLVKDIIFILSISNELQLDLQMPAIIMEDNSAVVTVTTDDAAYIKKCKHFLMVTNYVREQVNLGLIQINNARSTGKKILQTFIPSLFGMESLRSSRRRFWEPHPRNAHNSLFQEH